MPFPFDDLSGDKVRPAVCLTDAVGSYRHVVLAFITSQAPPDPLDSDLTLDFSDPDFPATGLKVSSTVRLHRMMTVATSLIRRELGELSPRLQASAANRLKSLFKLP